MQNDNHSIFPLQYPLLITTEQPAPPVLNSSGPEVFSERVAVPTVNARPSVSIDPDHTAENNTTAPPFSYDGYQVVRGEFFAHLFEPSVTFNNEKVSVNAAALRKLPDVEYVQFLVNPKEKKLAIKPSAEEAKDSFCWSYIASDGKRRSKSISCKIFFAKIADLMGWNPMYRYKILGKLIRSKEDTLFVFDLTSAETYRNRSETGQDTSHTALYPKDWQNCFGISVDEHRDKVLVNIFDDYTVFKIERNEGGNKPDDRNNVNRFEEESYQNSSNNPAEPE